MYRAWSRGGLPRLLRRGLIEAKWITPAGIVDTEDFPGYFAGASLKGWSAAETAAEIEIDFPGYFAGASLKGSARRHWSAVRRSDFPGYFAGASLKGAIPVFRSVADWLTSPATSPGPH